MKKHLFIIFFLFLSVSSFASNWNNIIKNRSGKVTVYYFPIEPFIYKDDLGQLTGIEKEVIESFFRFVENKYEVKIFQEWVEVNNFEDLIKKVASSKENAFGVSIISKTEQRAEIVAFSESHMPDVSLLLTHISVPLLEDRGTLIEELSGKQGATIPNTTHQSDLKQLSDKYGLKLEYREVSTDQDIMELVGSDENVIGYVGLPFYVRALKKGLEVKRQTRYQIERDGYRFLYQKDKGWNEVVQQHFASPTFQTETDQIIRKYLGEDYSNLIFGVSKNHNSHKQEEEINFLTREKEMQSKRLVASQKEKELQRLIIISISVGLVFIFFILLLLLRNNRIRAKDNALLAEKGRAMENLVEQLNAQKDEILHQRQLLQEKNSELTLINKQKDELIGLVAHDLKSPINQMSGLINLLGFKNDTWDEDERQIYEKLESSNKHLKELVERILDLDAISKKSLSYNLMDVDMARVMKDTIEDFKEKAEFKKIAFVESLPHKIMIRADPFFLRQVFENLLSNAIKFSPPNTSVFISSNEVDDYYHIIIRDQGPGISKSDQAKLFTRYQTLSAMPTGDESSTGLGLSIVKKYVEEMHGSVWYESSSGGGATFIVAFSKIT